jgi:F0F1-type ATP synthase membrane subunit b/b'
MEFTDKVSALIFALIFIGAVIYVIMSRFVVGPVSKLKRGEQVVIAVSIVGILLVIVYAAVELLWRIVF